MIHQQISHFHFGGDCFGFRSDLPGANPLVLCSVCVYRRQECFQVQAICLFPPLKAFLIFLALLSPTMYQLYFLLLLPDQLHLP